VPSAPVHVRECECVTVAVTAAETGVTDAGLPSCASAKPARASAVTETSRAASGLRCMSAPWLLAREESPFAAPPDPLVRRFAGAQTRRLDGDRTVGTG